MALAEPLPELVPPTSGLSEDGLQAFQGYLCSVHTKLLLRLSIPSGWRWRRRRWTMRAGMRFEKYAAPSKETCLVVSLDNDAVL